jgi:hypothetical protein
MMLIEIRFNGATNHTVASNKPSGNHFDATRARQAKDDQDIRPKS